MVLSAYTLTQASCFARPALIGRSRSARLAAICVRRGTGSRGLRSDAAGPVVTSDGVLHPDFKPSGRAWARSSVRGDLLAGGDRVEARVRLAELERHLADRPVAVLGDLRLDELDLGVGVLLAVAVEEDDDVGVLLDRAPISRRSLRRGSAEPRCSTLRDSCRGRGPAPSARGPAAFRPRLISDTSWTRLLSLFGVDDCISWR